MNTIGIHTASSNWNYQSLFKTKPFVSTSNQKGINSKFECYCNQTYTKECEAISNVFAFGVKKDRLRNESFSNLAVFISAFEKAPLSQLSSVNAEQKRISFASCSYEERAV